MDKYFCIFDATNHSTKCFKIDRDDLKDNVYSFKYTQYKSIITHPKDFEDDGSNIPYLTFNNLLIRLSYVMKIVEATGYLNALFSFHKDINDYEINRNKKLL